MKHALLILAISCSAFAQRGSISDKDRGGGSPITIEAKRIENRIHRELKSKLTFYVERMNPENLHFTVQPIYKDMLSRGLEKAIDDSEFITTEPCLDDLEITDEDGIKKKIRRRVPASAPEKKIGGKICMDPIMIAELKMGDMLRLIELAYHEHGHNFGYGEDDSNNLAAEVGDTYDETNLKNPRFMAESKTLPSFIREAKYGLCVTSEEVDVQLFFENENGWFGTISFVGKSIANHNALSSYGKAGNSLLARIKQSENTGNGVVGYGFDTRVGTKPPVYISIKDVRTKERYVKKIEKPYEINFFILERGPGSCGDQD